MWERRWEDVSDLQAVGSDEAYTPGRISKWRSLAVPLAALGFKEAAKLQFLVRIPDFTDHIELVGGTWLAIIFVFSTLAGVLSDHKWLGNTHPRKLVLCVTLGGTVLGGVLLSLGFLWPAIIVDGTLGNVTPVARAAYVDGRLRHRNSNRHKARRHRSQKLLVIVETQLAQCAAWLIICSSTVLLFNWISWISVLGNVVLLSLAVGLFRDRHDTDSLSTLRHTFKTIWKFSSSSFLRLAAAYLLLELGFQLFPYYFEGHKSGAGFQQFNWFLFVGAATGLIVQVVYRFSDYVRTVHLVALGSLVPMAFYLFGDRILGIPNDVSWMAYLLLPFLSGISWPATYAAFAEKAEIHETGLVFGVMESLSSLAELVAPFFILGIVHGAKLDPMPFILIFGGALLLTAGCRLVVRPEREGTESRDQQ